jgi:hypothetical protein
MPQSESPEELKRAIDFGVRQSIRSTPNLRELAIEWILSGEDAGTRTLESLLIRVWNGMRRLPYDNSEISEAMGATALLFKLGISRQVDSSKKEALLEGHFGVVQEVEFATSGGGGARAWVPTATLKDALRPGLEQLLTEKIAALVSDDFSNLFQVIYNPRKLFEFAPFRALFTGYCIPMQVVDNRQLTLFNLAELETFGNP